MIKELTDMYQDEPHAHMAMWGRCLTGVADDELLTRHRDFIEQGLYGYGDRPYHYAWKALVDTMPPMFSFLEIGVFQGQVLSLVKLLASRMKKMCKVVGVTPLASDGDQFGTHPTLDYLERIKRVHAHFKLPSPMILKGSSFDPRIKRLAKAEGPYDLVYIDGCHDFDVVLDDMMSYAPMLRTGGYLVVDDAATDLRIPDGLIPTNFRGIKEVTDAMNIALHQMSQTRPMFQHQFAVGHVRVFKRVF